MIQAKLGASGALSTLVLRKRVEPELSWRVRNTLRRTFIWGWIANNLAKAFTKVTGIPTITAELRAELHKANGQIVDYGVLSRRVVTNAGVAFLVDDWDDDTTDITNMNYHGCGTDNTAENVTDTALGAESTTALNPNSTRATGTKSQPSANILQSVGTLTFDDTAAVVEHGLLSQEATGGGVLWDRSVFAAINVGSGDSIQFTYACTVNAGS